MSPWFTSQIVLMKVQQKMEFLPKSSGTMGLSHSSQSQKVYFRVDIFSNWRSIHRASLTHRVTALMARREGQVEGPRTALPQPTLPCLESNPKANPPPRRNDRVSATTDDLKEAAVLFQPHPHLTSFLALAKSRWSWRVAADYHTLNQWYHWQLILDVMTLLKRNNRALGSLKADISQIKSPTPIPISKDNLMTFTTVYIYY